MKLSKKERFEVTFRNKNYLIASSNDVIELFAKRVVHPNELDVFREAINPFLKKSFKGKNYQTIHQIFDSEYNDFISMVYGFERIFPYQSKTTKCLSSISKIMVVLGVCAMSYGALEVIKDNIKHKQNLEYQITYPEPKLHKLPYRPPRQDDDVVNKKIYI